MIKLFTLKELPLTKCWICMWWVMADKSVASGMKTEGRLPSLKKRGLCASVGVTQVLLRIHYTTKKNLCLFLWREESPLYVSTHIKYLPWTFPLTFNKIFPIPQSSPKLSSLLPLSDCLISSCLSVPLPWYLFSIFFPSFLCASPPKKSLYKFIFPIREMGYCNYQWDCCTTK